MGMFLRRVREEEKHLRKSFVSSHGQHFIATLFPELMERVPDISVSSSWEHIMMCLFVCDVVYLIVLRFISHAH